MSPQSALRTLLEERNRETGIAAIGAVPWGTHLCLFYETKQDLFDVLVPYFKAGLANNEFCIWVTSPPLSEKEAEKALREAVPNFTQYLESGQIAIVPHTELYLKDGVSNLHRVLNTWLDKLNLALAEGYDGMRVTGNLAWLEEQDWTNFISYGKRVNSVIGKYHMLALCTFPLAKWGASEVVDVMGNHQFTLRKQAGDWVVIGGPGRKQVRQALRESQEKYRKLFAMSPVGITTLDMKGVITSCNPAVYRVGGYSEGELVGKHFTKIAPVRLRDIPKFLRVFSSIIRGKVPQPFVVEYHCKDGTTGWSEIHVSLLKEGRRKLGIQVIQRDITEHKRVEETAWQSDKKYRKLFGHMLNGFVYCKILLDENNQPIDFIHLKVNDAWERLSGLKREDVIGKRITEVIPGIKKSKTDLISIYGKVALTGKETKFELCFEPLKKWFAVSVYSPQEEYFIAVFEDITELKRVGETVAAVALRGRLTSLQKEFLKSGLEGFKDREIIELLLLSPDLSPRECTKLTKQVAEQFKTLRQLVAASPEELRQAGVTPHGIIHIKFVREIATEILKRRITDQPNYKSSKEIMDYLNYAMRDLKKEVFKVIYLNNRNQIIDTEDLFEGTLESIPIRPREIVEGVVEHKAAALIFAHNHPTGEPTPSRSDKQLTRDLVFIGNILQIKVLDHVIIGENTYFSFADDGLIRKYEDNFLNLKMRGVFDIGVGYGKKLPAVFIPLLPAIYLTEEAVVRFL